MSAYILMSGSRPKRRCKHNYLRRGYAAFGVTAVPKHRCGQWHN